MIVSVQQTGGSTVNGETPIIAKVEFIKASYKKMRAHVAARNFSSLTYRTRGRVLIESEGSSLREAFAIAAASAPRAARWAPST